MKGTSVIFYVIYLYIYVSGIRAIMLSLTIYQDLALNMSDTHGTKETGNHGYE
jgi:hypothetical protein